MLISVIRSLFSGGQVDLMGVLMQIAVVLFIIFLILPLHEWAHGFVAYKLGDPTAKNSGRLTLNPMASFDPFGALFLLLFGFGWAKPVPVDTRYFKNPKRGMAITAFAGPLSNLIAALAGALIYVGILVATKFNAPALISLFFSNYIVINVSLAVFNLLPIPPLDGSKILGAFLPSRIMYQYYRYENIIMMGLFLLLFTGALDVPLSFLRSGFLNGIMWLAKLPFQAFGVI